MSEVVSKEDYWQIILNDPSKVGQITTEDEKFNKVAEFVYTVVQNTLLISEDEDYLKKYEEMIDISGEGLTPYQRKVNILYMLSGKNYIPLNLVRRGLINMGISAFDIEFLKDENKLVLRTDRLDDAMLESVNSLLESALPQNIEVVHTNYFTWLPSDYTDVEYLEGTGAQWMYIPVNDKKEDTLEVETYGAFTSLQNGVEGKNGGHDSSFFWGISGNLYAGVGGYNVSGTKPDTGWHSFVLCKTKENGGFFVDDKKLLSMPFPSVSLLGGWGYGLWKIVNENRFPNQVSKKASVKFIQNGKLIYDFVPALDPTGAPCMFDLVSRKPFYNQGAGDFLYPTDAAPVMTTDLDEKFYAQLTEHGVRRLYKVPDGCNMTKDEYAAANGFKEIVEPPMPLEGYWRPEWRETDTQLVLEWVETEPPMEAYEHFNLEMPQIEE